MIAIFSRNGYNTVKFLIKMGLKENVTAFVKSPKTMAMAVISLEDVSGEVLSAEEYLKKDAERQTIFSTVQGELAKNAQNVATFFAVRNLTPNELFSPPEKTVKEMVAYFKQTLADRGYLSNQKVKEAIIRWSNLDNQTVYWTDDEKHALERVIDNAEFRYKNNVEKEVSAILRACDYIIKKEIQEKNQPRHSFDDLVNWHEEMGIEIEEKYKGKPDMPTILLKKQKHGRKENLGTQNSQDNIYSYQEKLYKAGICTNFGYEGLDPIEMDSNLIQKESPEWEKSYRYEYKKEWDFEENYLGAFSFGIENPELLVLARIAEKNYLLMRKIAKHSALQKNQFEMSTLSFLEKIKFNFSKSNGYETLIKEVEVFLKNKQTLTYNDYVQLFFHFRDEWQQKVHDDRNEGVGKVTEKMAKNTGDLSGYVVMVKIGGNHFKVTKDHWNMAPEEAEEACYRIQEVYEDLGWSYIVLK